MFRFKSVLKNSFFIFLAMMNSISLKGQHPFYGSFIMSFNSQIEMGENPPMLWNIEQQSSGGMMAMELQDEMIKKGVSKRVLFNPKDSTWTMLMSFNNVKQGARIHRAEMFREKHDQKKITVTASTEKKMIDGFSCRKIITESKNYRAEIWVTKDLNFDICNIYKLLNHCSMMNDYVRKGDWFDCRIKGMILEVTSTKKLTAESYTLNISSVKVNEIDSSLFITKARLIWSRVGRV